MFSPVSVFLKPLPSHLSPTVPGCREPWGAGGSEVLGSPVAKIMCHNIML